MIQSYGLSHIQLTVSDLERSVRFYSEVLGMEELCRFGSTAAMLRTPKSHEVFTLNANPEGAEDIGKTGGIAHFGFRLLENVDMIELSEELEKAGAVVIEHGKRGKDKKETYLFARDPDGYEIEFFWMPEE